MNPTIDKFGYPASLIADYVHWVVLLRPAQVTLGSLVLAAKSEVTAYGALPREAFAEQADIVTTIEQALKRFCSFDRINYLMLMMVDPNVHFHVIPRYGQQRTWNGLSFADAGWPGPPNLAAATALAPAQINQMVEELSDNF